MIKKILLIALVALSSCAPKVNKEKTTIAVSILPQKYFVNKIAGNLANVVVLVTPGSSPETYSLRPNQMMELAQASAWFGIGNLDFEHAWKNKILDVTKNLKYFDVTKNANWIAAEVVKHGDHEHLHGIDPHVWTSAIEGTNIATQTYNALLEILPDNKKELKANYDIFIQEINELDKYLKETLAKKENKNLLIYHPSLGYLARDYGLNQIPLEIEGKEPSPKYIKDFIEMAQENNLKNIFIQKEFNKSTAQMFAKELGGNVVIVDPLNENWDKQLREIADKILAN